MKSGRAKLRPGSTRLRAWRAIIKLGRADKGAWMANVIRFWVFVGL